MTKTADWVTAPWMAFDTETTGVSPTNDRLVTAATVVRLGGLNAFDPDQAQTWLADPGVEIPQAASEVHGITTDRARKMGTPIAGVLEEVNQVLAAHLGAGYPVVIFNAGFDLRLLESESQRHGVATLTDRLGRTPSPIIDPLVLDRAVDRYRKGRRTLGSLCELFDITVQNAHDAAADGTMTLDVLAKILETHPQVAALSPSELQEFQMDSHRQWAERLTQWHRSQGRESNIDPEWF